MLESTRAHFMNINEHRFVMPQKKALTRCERLIIFVDVIVIQTILLFNAH